MRAGAIGAGGSAATLLFTSRATSLLQDWEPCGDRQPHNRRDADAQLNSERRRPGPQFRWQPDRDRPILFRRGKPPLEVGARPRGQGRVVFQQCRGGRVQR
jgi:hypothetical protein